MEPVTQNQKPAISVVVLNYNGARWIERCLASIRGQTIFSRLEVIVADNHSTDGSDKLAERLINDWPNGKIIQHGANLGYTQGNNLAAAQATGEFLFILNNDAWLENDCLEILLRVTREKNAGASCPLVMNFDDNTFQSLGIAGFDLFGLSSTRKQFSDNREIFMPEGCSWLVEKKLYDAVGGLDPEIFMYSDEYDFAFKLWIAGSKATAVPAARVHHRGAANVNPAGGVQVVEFRTSDTKRFYANRNGLLVILKNAQHILLLLAVLQTGLLLLEAMAALVLVRRWSFIDRAYLKAFRDVWRLRHHIRAERKKARFFRRRSDWWMLRFLRWRPNRLEEVIQLWRNGPPKVTSN